MRRSFFWPAVIALVLVLCFVIAFFAFTREFSYDGMMEGSYAPPQPQYASNGCGISCRMPPEANWPKDISNANKDMLAADNFAPFSHLLTQMTASPRGRRL